jgi:hypothetical protein
VLVGDRIRSFVQGCFPLEGTKVWTFETLQPRPLTYGMQPDSLGLLTAPSWRLWPQMSMPHFKFHRLHSHQWIPVVNKWRQGGWAIPEGWQRAIC